MVELAFNVPEEDAETTCDVNSTLEGEKLQSIPTGMFPHPSRMLPMNRFRLSMAIGAIQESPRWIVTASGATIWKSGLATTVSGVAVDLLGRKFRSPL
jgi:hypothetical protein